MGVLGCLFHAVENPSRASFFAVLKESNYSNLIGICMSTVFEMLSIN